MAVKTRQNLPGALEVRMVVPGGGKRLEGSGGFWEGKRLGASGEGSAWKGLGAPGADHALCCDLGAGPAGKLPG